MAFMLFGDHPLGPDYPFDLNTSRREDGTVQKELRLLCRLNSCIPESSAGQLEETPACRLRFIQHNLTTTKKTHGKYRFP